MTSLVVLALFAVVFTVMVWHDHKALGILTAHLHARREGLRAQRLALAWYRLRLKEDA